MTFGLYAAEHITGADEALTLMVGVDTRVFQFHLNCGATGAITGIGNALPTEVLQLIKLCELAVDGNYEARRYALILEKALSVLSTFDEGPDLVLYYKHLLVLNGESEYALHFNETDELSPSQKQFIESQYRQFKAWWNNWPAKTFGST